MRLLDKDTYRQMLVVTLVGTVATIVTASVIWLQVADHQRAEFEWVAQNRNRAFKKAVEEALDAVNFLAEVLRLGNTVRREDFQLLAGALRERHPGIQSFEWLPRVFRRERERWEAAADEVESGHAITQLDLKGDYVSAGQRVEYFPVLFREPTLQDGTPLGFDRASDPVQREFIERAVETGEMVVSGRVPLDPEHARFGVMVFVPVFRESSPGAHRRSEESNLAGIVVGMLRLADIANRSIALLEPRGVEFLVRDLSAPEDMGFLDFYTSRLGPEARVVDGRWQGWSLPDAPQAREVFQVADRTWSVTCSATQHYRSAEGFKEGPWFVLGGGLILTFLASLFVHSVRAQMNARLRVEQELRRSEQQLSILFHQSPDIIMTVKENARILMLNRPWPKAPTESAVGRNSKKVLPKVLRRWYGSALKKVFRTGETDHLQHCLTDSSWWEVRIVPLRVDGIVTTAMVIATDVTESRLIEAQAIRNARLATLGVLAAGVAHEINNPNSSIQFNASLLQKSFTDIVPILQRAADEQGAFMVGGVPVARAIEGIPRMLSGLVRSSQRIQCIVANLKHLVSQDQEDWERPVDLGNVLRSAFSMVQHEVQTHTDFCKLEVPDPPPVVRGNSQQLEQVFINLLLNALHSLPSRSSRVWVTAETEPGGGHVRISVVDQGCGIRDEDQQRIFDPFYTTRPNQGGTGLGLSIVQRIVQKHHGSIAVNSQHGVGTEVVVHLPILNTT